MVGDKLTKLYNKVHEITKDGCKSSCTCSEYGYRLERNWDEVYYYFRFGGYCIGRCSRWEEVRGKTEEELVLKVKKVFQEALDIFHDIE